MIGIWWQHGGPTLSFRTKKTLLTVSELFVKQDETKLEMIQILEN